MLVHNLGLELPVYPEGTPFARTTAQIRDAANSDAPDFLRRVHLVCPGTHNLRQALALADIVLPGIADALDAQWIDPEWGLVKNPNRAPERYSFREHVPDGYDLVAKVDTIRPVIEFNDSTRTELNRRINRHQESIAIGKYLLYDLHYPQFVQQAQPEADPQLWLVDVDPKLEIKQYQRTYSEHW